jgi:lysophospholipase L1-like esterase
MTGKRTSLYTRLGGVIVVLTAVALLGLIALGIVTSMTPDAPDLPTDRPLGEDPTATTTVTSGTNVTGNSTDDPGQPAKAPVTLTETADMGQAYQDSILFVGDSTTAHLRSRGVLTGGTETRQVWVPSDNTLLLDFNITKKKIVYPATGIEMTIAEATEKDKPAYMILTIGLNGITSFVNNKNLYQNCYGSLIDTIKKASPDTKIILQSVYPVAANQRTFTADAVTLNGYIDILNGYVKELAADKEVRYLDTNSALKGPDGLLPESYQNGDGIHLTAEGYRVILDYIRTHGYQ